MATGSFAGEVEGIDDLQAGRRGDPRPGRVPAGHRRHLWTFQLMIGFGALAGLVSVLGLCFTRKTRPP